MALFDVAREQLVNQVFSSEAGLAKTVTWKSLGSTTENSRGEVESSASTDTSVQMVMWNVLSGQTQYESFGDLQPGDIDVAFPHTAIVEKDDLVTFTDYTGESVTYRVDQVQPNYLDENVALIARLTKELN